MCFKWTRFFLLAVFLLSGLRPAMSEQKPNVIIIFNDDQGYQDLGCYGSPDIKTPHVDRLAAEGMRFTDFYVASPVCSASRAALLTGCYPYRVGVPSVFWPNRAHGLSPEYLTLAEVLKSAGYATKAVGKWHLGDEPQFLPINQGFDSYYGIPYSNDMYPARTMKYADDCLYLEGFTPEKIEAVFAELKKGQPKTLKNKVPLMRDRACIEFPCDQTTITRRYGDESIEFINQCAAETKPFFLYLANTMPHIPLFASPDFRGKSARGLYGDVIEEIDYTTGRIMDCLEKAGIESNTMVIFTSDNGPWLTMGKNGGCAQPLFEGKFTNFEGGQRVPCIIKWPERIPAGSVCTDMALSMDLFPTLAQLAGAEVNSPIPLDGKNIISLLTAKKDAVSPHEFFFFGDGHTYNAVRSGVWKYHRKEIFKVKASRREFKGPTLYNLKDDIGESRNIIDEHPEVAERLDKALETHIAHASTAALKK